MEETEIDKLVANIEGLTTDINKLNFDLEGLREETDELEEKRPFMRRQIDLNNKKMNKLMHKLIHKQDEKKNLDAELGAYQLKKASETNPNIPEEPKKE